LQDQDYGLHSKKKKHHGRDDRHYLGNGNNKGRDQKNGRQGEQQQKDDYEKRLREANRCFICFEIGHKASECTRKKEDESKKPERPARFRRITQSGDEIYKSVTIKYKTLTQTLDALIDTGATADGVIIKSALPFQFKSTNSHTLSFGPYSMTSFGTVKCVIDQVEAELQVVEDIDGSTKLLLGLPFQKRAGYIIDTVNMRVLQGNEFWKNDLDGDPSEDSGDHDQEDLDYAP
jgi:predicted aspartyl protease